MGLSVNPGEFQLENLKIGQSYDLSKIAKPLLIRYSGAEKCDLVITIYKPPEPIAGYEVIPDTGWVKIDKDFYPALPGEDVRVAIVLSIPDDEQYLGKRYDVRLSVTARARVPQGKVGLNPAVATRIVFGIFKERGTVVEQKRFEEVLQMSRNISFTPTELYLDDVPVGKEVDVKKEFKKSMKLSNLNESAISLIMKCWTPKELGLDMPGYESIDDKSVVKISKNKIKVKPDKIEEVKLCLKFPDKKEYRGRKFLVICEASIDTDVLATQYRTRIFITTQK